MTGNTRTAIVAGVAGAAVGALVTFLALGLRDDAPPAESASARSAAAPTGRPSAAGDVRTRTPTRAASAAAPDAAPAASTAGGSSAADALLAQARIDLPARVEAAFTGFVRTTDGAPVAGAVVRAAASRQDPYATSIRAGKAPPLPSAADSLKDAATDAKWRAATTREATTDASGAFTIDGLVDAAYSVSAWAEGYRVFSTGAGNGAVRPGAKCEFLAKPVIDVPLTVVAADGSTPTERIIVRWSAGPGRGGGMTYWTAASPTVQIDPGAWDVTAETQPGEGDESKSKPVRATVAVGAPTPPVTLRLEPRNLLVGTVTMDPADAGWESLNVFVRAPGSTNERGDGEKRTVLRAPDWKYRFEDLPAGEYEVVVSIDGMTPLATATARVSTGTARQDVAMPRLTSAQFVEVRVVGPDGLPLVSSDVSFQVKAKSGRSSSSWGSNARGRRADGALLLSLPGPKSGNAVSDPASRWTIEVRSKAFGSKELEFTPGTTTRLDVQLP